MVTDRDVRPRQPGLSGFGEIEDYSQAQVARMALPPFEDVNRNGRFDAGTDEPIRTSELADGEYHAGMNRLVIPVSAGSIAAETVEFTGEGVTIETDLEAVAGGVEIDAGMGSIRASGIEIETAGKLELNSNANDSIHVSGSTLSGEAVEIFSRGDLDAANAEIEAEEKIELVTNGNLDISNATLTAEKVEIDADGSVTDTDVTIIEGEEGEEEAEDEAEAEEDEEEDEAEQEEEEDEAEEDEEEPEAA